MLHITNGESVVGTMRDAALAGDHLSWIDVLHDGPVPGGRTLHELSDVRARALEEMGRQFPDDSSREDYAAIRAGFARRDQALEDFRRHKEVVLWFEHDLFDQLQLVQLLDWFSRHTTGETKISIIQLDSHPDVKPFYGLGQLNAAQLSALFPQRSPVTAEMLREGREAWAAFTSTDPMPLLGLAQAKPTALPYLPAALRRFLQEYPGTSDGLSRTQRQILRAVNEGHSRQRNIYQAASRNEDVPWGDMSVYWRLLSLCSGPEPALRRSGDEFLLTEAGKRLLEGKVDWIALNGGVDQWLGGVHLTGREPAWRWDELAKELRPRG